MNDAPFSLKQAAFYLAAIVGLIVVGIWTSWMWPAAGAEATECEFPESLLVTALQDKSDWPERTHRVLEGADAQTFLNKATAKGYISGSLSLVNKIYIIDAKVAAGATPKVWVFLIQDGCIIGKLAADKPQVEECLP